MSWESPIGMVEENIYKDIIEKETGALLATVEHTVGFKVDKEELLKALEYDRGQYEKGVWDMFELITSAYYGKQYYFLEPLGIVYSRASGKYIKRDEAYREFLRMIGGEE